MEVHQDSFDMVEFRRILEDLRIIQREMGEQQHAQCKACKERTRIREATETIKEDLNKGGDYKEYSKIKDAERDEEVYEVTKWERVNTEEIFSSQ